MAILGIDEVGRGPLAGPLVVGAVILPEPRPDWVDELRDSKKLTAKKREALNEKILSEAATGLGWVSAAELDAVGISEALQIATKRAVKSVQGLHVSFSQIIIDGKVNFLKQTPLEQYVSTVVKGDDLIREISAASIIAKVARDHYMMELASEFPNYGFDSHVGYGTARHLAAITKYGICAEHRKSFEPIRSMVGFEREMTPRKNTTMIGQKAEAAVANYLEEVGHEIIQRNFKTRDAEIDIVSRLEKKIFFTEVKYRKNGGGLLAINAKKKQQMEYAAKVFMKFHPEYRKYDAQLAVAEVNGNYAVGEWFALDF